MYRRILMAYDGTLEGRTALREGALLAKRLQADVFLLSIVPQTVGVRMAESAHAGAMETWQSRHQAIFEEGLQRLRELGFTPQARLVAGEPAEQIAAYAQEVGADLVVVGHRRQSLWARWWSGSSGAYLSDHLECSLLIGRNEIEAEDFRRELDQINAGSSGPPTAVPPA